MQYVHKSIVDTDHAPADTAETVILKDSGAPALPGEEQVAEMPVVAPVQTQLGKPEASLFTACVRGDSSLIRRTAAHRKVDFNVVSEFGAMLAVAAVSGHVRAVRELLWIPGIDVNLAGAEKVTPLPCHVQGAHGRRQAVAGCARDQPQPGGA